MLQKQSFVLIFLSDQVHKKLIDGVQHGGSLCGNGELLARCK